MTPAANEPTTNRAITVTDLNTTVNCEPRVLDLRLAEALGFTDRHMIRALIRRHLDTLKLFGEVTTQGSRPGKRGGRPGTDYFLNKRQALFITAKSDTERAALVTVEMVEVFDAVTSGRADRRIARRPRAQRAVSRDVLATYATWLWGERRRVLEELYADLPPGHRTGVAVNAGYFYHEARPGEVLAPPSTRAVNVLRMVGCPMPAAPKLKS